MKSHLVIEGDRGELALKPDTGITATEKNPMFNETEMFSQPIALPFQQNRKVLGNMDAVDSDMQAIDVENERYRFVIDGVPFRSTVLKVQDASEMRNTLSVNFDATNRTFKDMIANMRCRDVTVDDDIFIGQKIGDLAVNLRYRCDYDILIEQGGRDFVGYKIYCQWATIGDNTFQPPVLGFSVPGVEQYSDSQISYRVNDTIDGKNVKIPNYATKGFNTSQPYPTAKFCSSRICYAHHDKETENGSPKVEDGSYVTSGDIVQGNGGSNNFDFGPFWMLPADRPATGICFYVAYFLERLFKDLGLAYDMDALTNIPDFNYLCFFNTGCKHRDVFHSLSGYTLYSVDDINEWLEERGCGGKLVIEDEKPADQELASIGVTRIILTKDNADPTLKWDRWERVGDHGIVTGGYLNNGDTIDIDYTIGSGGSTFVPGTEGLEHYINAVKKYTCEQTVSAKVMDMYATSDNFPNVNVADVITSLENTFGVRFCYDEESHKVTVRLLRDMFQRVDADGVPLPIIPFKGIVTDMYKMSEKITGVRMKYSSESDEQDQNDNIRYQKRDYNTTYDYKEYPQDRVLLKSYADVIEVIDIGNMKCYVDMTTGNAYRIKVSKEATTVTELKPSVFEVGQFKGAELGDCSKENEDYIKEFVSNFEPIITNNLRNPQGNIIMVPFADADMEHELVTKKIQNAWATPWGHSYITYQLNLLESYDPSQTDDGQSPLMDYDWGLTIGILRPGSEGATTYEYDDGYDGFGNSRWGIRSGEFCVASDSYDVFGNFLGVEDAEATAISLKPRAYKPFRYKYVDENLLISTDPKQWESEEGWLIPCNADTRNASTGRIIARIASRGTCDTFMSEFFHFILKRQPYKVKARCTAAELVDIPNHWLNFWEIDGMIGLINVVKYSATVEKGLGEVEIDFYVI